MSNGQLTIGVLGHVDHGKTSLVKALTGIDTDRLEEEKRRGLSIVLGFAYLESKSGSVDLIDVPGHESFIRAMIAGATGFDGIMLVVSAEEGIKPQTREHFHIARLLGIRQGIIVITKKDLVPADRLNTVRAEINTFIKGTFLESAPIHPVSITDEASLSGLHSALTEMMQGTPPRNTGDYFYLPLDRVFTIGGYGTIGTGTLRNGKITVDDEIEIMPTGIKANVREIQVHKHRVQEAFPGQRVAVNLRGVKRDQIARGDILITPGSMRATTNILARLHVLDELPRVPKRNEPVRLLFGTTDVIAKLRVLDQPALQAGSDVLVQIRCQDPVIAGTNEHFIVRTCSPVITFGGGEFLDTSMTPSKKPAGELIDYLQNLERGDINERIREHVLAAGTGGIDLISLIERTATTREKLLAVLRDNNILIIDATIAISRAGFDVLMQKALNLLADHHRSEPSQPGLRLEAFRSAFSGDTQTLILEQLLKTAADTDRIIIDGNNVRLAGFSQEAGISEEERKLINSIEKIFLDSGASTPDYEEIIGKNPGKKRAYDYLKDSGKLIPLRDTSSRKLYIFHANTLNDIRSELNKKFPYPKTFTVAEVRSLINSTRKYVVPILEYFDRTRVTVRKGDFRTVSPTTASTEK